MSKKVFLKDFSEDTQKLLRKFGISEDLDIKADFEKYLSENKIDINQKLNEFSAYYKHLEGKEKLDYSKNHKKNIVINKDIKLQSNSYRQEHVYSLAS